MLQSILVAFIVVGATGYAAWALTPAVSRTRFALRLAQRLGEANDHSLRARAATWLRRLAKAPVGGCSDCPANTLTPAERARSAAANSSD